MCWLFLRTVVLTCNDYKTGASTWSYEVISTPYREAKLTSYVSSTVGTKMRHRQLVT
jgi:hypothetical protein